MKILQINNCHYRRGGADAVYLNTIDLLKRKGHDVIEFSQKHDYNFASENSDYFIKNYDPFNASFIKKVFNTPRQLYSSEAKRKLKKLIRDKKPQIAHIHLYKGNLTGSIIPVLKRHNIPVCISLHDYNILCPRSLFYDSDNKICELCLKGNSINSVLKKCNRHNFFYSFVNFLEYNLNNKVLSKPKNINTLIAVSKFILEKHSMRDELEHKLVHLYNFAPECENKIYNDVKGSYFLYFGRLTHEKGLITLFSAFKKNKKIKLIVVGTGYLEKQLKDKIADENLENIEMIGYKSGDELEALVLDCSFVIVPSEWYENNPMTIIESYTMGKPVIGSEVGGIPELIIENETGFTFKMGNIDELSLKIAKANELSQTEYCMLSKNARKFALENFSEEQHYKKLIDIYKNAIAKIN